MTYPRDYRQEKAYECSGIGVIITLVIVVAIMGVVLILSGSTPILPYVVSYEWNPEVLAAMPYFTLFTVVLVVVLSGSWIHNRIRQADSEGQHIHDVED